MIFIVYKVIAEGNSFQKFPQKIHQNSEYCGSQKRTTFEL